VRKTLIASLLALCLFPGLGTSAFALTAEEASAIQTFVDDARRISRAPGISVSVVADGKAYFFSSGVTSRETHMPAYEDTLWELASVSKAFTGLGMLYLEKQGYLSLTDSIVDHLPWLTFTYRGQPVDMQGVRLYHFLHHTVGITNEQHPNLVWERPEPDTLQSTVEALTDAELTFYPGERMQYGTKNYNVLGLVMANAVGQSFEDLMEERIFHPLGMMQTFADRDRAEATGLLAQGHFSTFVFITQERDSMEARGSVPTGYFITSARDMARWMEIQLGIVEDIPAIFKELVPRSHVGDRSVEIAGFRGRYSYYAAGWFVSEDGSIVEHGGGNPSFATHILLLPDEQIGITILSNSTTPDTMRMADSIADILDGNLRQRYTFIGQNMKTIDVTFTITTVVGGLLAILFFFLGLCRMKRHSRRPITKKRVALIVFWSLVTLTMGVIGYMLPRLTFGGGWDSVARWLGYSPLAAMLALILLCVSVVWFVISPCRKMRSVYPKG